MFTGSAPDRILGRSCIVPLAPAPLRYALDEFLDVRYCYRNSVRLSLRQCVCLSATLVIVT